MSLQKIDALHSQLRAGTLTLDFGVAQELDAAYGHRLAKEELDEYLVIAAEVAQGSIKADARGQDALFDTLKKKPETRFTHAFALAREWAGFGSKVGAAIGGAAGAVGGATAGLAAGPVSAAYTAAAATFAAGVSAGTIGGVGGFVAGGVYGAVRD